MVQFFPLKAFVLFLTHFHQTYELDMVHYFDLFSKHSLMQSDFVILSSLLFYDIAEIPLKYPYCQLFIIQDKGNTWQDSILSENEHSNHMMMLIFPSNLSRLQYITTNHKEDTKSSLNDLATYARVSYFLIWPDTTSDSLTENALLKNVSQAFNLNANIYVVQRKFANIMKEDFLVKIDIYDLYSVNTLSIIEKVYETPCISLSSNNYISKRYQDFLDVKILNKISRRKNFHLANVIALSQPGGSNRVVMMEHGNGSATLISGHEVEEYRFLRDYFNFSENAVNSSGWAYRNEKGILQGMAAQLLKNEADIVITNSELSADWLNAVVFLHPTYFSTMKCYFMQPKWSSIRDVFIKPFCADVWIAMFSTWLLIVVATITLFLIVHSKVHKLCDIEKSLLNEILLWASGSACQQGWYTYPESTSLKIMILSGSAMGFVIITAYSASLVAILSVKVYPVRSLEDLVSQNFLIYRGDEIYATTNVLDELINKGKIRERKSISSGNAVPKILSLKFALLGISDVFHPAMREQGISDKETCSLLSQIDVTWRPITAAMFLPKHSQYKEYFNFVLLLMHERGNRFRLLNNYMKDSSIFCLPNEDVQWKEELAFSDLFTAFIILIAGVIVTSAVFIIEFFITKRVDMFLI